MISPNDLRVLPAASAAGTSRTIARRLLLPYRHLAVTHPEDFLVSLGALLGVPPSEEPHGYVLWHKPSGHHFTAYVHASWAAYGGGLCFDVLPEESAIASAYADRGALLATKRDPHVADLAGEAADLADHRREVEEARQQLPDFVAFLEEFERLLEQYPPADRCKLKVHAAPGDGPVSVSAEGVLSASYFERPADIEEAWSALQENRDAAGAAAIFYRWWAAQKRPVSPGPELAAVLLAAWRTQLDEGMRSLEPSTEGAYRADARARHDEVEVAQRWMRHAKLGLRLPLGVKDFELLEQHANDPARRSAEYAKLQKIKRA